MRLGRAGLIFLVSSGFVTGAIAAGRTKAPLALEQRLLSAGELAGFTPDQPSTVTTVDDWAKTCPPGETKRLRKAGFVAAAAEHLHSVWQRCSDGEGYDVLFSDGVFSYDVGAFTVDPKGRPTAAGVAAAATTLYRRVHGRP
jgi:hypothetical protein